MYPALSDTDTQQNFPNDMLGCLVYLDKLDAIHQLPHLVVDRPEHMVQRCWFM